MKKGKNIWLFKKILNNGGFSIVEIIVATAVFILLTASSAILLFSGEDVEKININIAKATLYAQEGLEATRAIRDSDWGLVVQGDHGLSSTSGEWIFEGTSDVLEDKYRRTITITDINENKKEIKSSVRWYNSSEQEKKIELVTYLTNWQRLVEEQSGGVDLGDSAKDVYVSGDYAYLAINDNHKSLAIVDVSNPESPQVVSNLDLNGKGIDVWVDGNYAYVVLDVNKMKIVDVSNPESPNEVASVNLSAQPTAVYIYNHYAYIGQAKTNEGLAIYNVANPTTPYYYGSYSFRAGKVYDVKAVNGWIYVAVNAGRGFDVFDAGSYAYAVVAVNVSNGGFETYYLQGSYISHLATVDVGAACNNVFYHNDKASIACKDIEGGLKIVDVSSMSSPQFLSSINVDGEGNGVFYIGGYNYIAVENVNSGLSITNQ